jgi:hypothetical protein
MAERRMFAKSIVDSDAFLDMPPSSQMLYFHLSMRADDDGFVNNPRKIQRMVNAGDDDMRVLIAKRFIIAFESGVIVIKHWRIHNYLQNDRHKPTLYQDEMKRLIIKENRVYTELTENDGALDTPCLQAVSVMDTQCIHHVSKVDTQYSIDKSSVEKSSKVEVSEGGTGGTDAGAGAPAHPRNKPIKHQYGEYGNVILSDDELAKLKEEYPDAWQRLIERLSGYIASTGKVYKSHLATMWNWANRDKDKPKEQTNGKKVAAQRYTQREYDPASSGSKAIIDLMGEAERYMTL